MILSTFVIKMSILIKNVSLNGRKTSIYIEENLITEIGAKTEADHIIDGKNKAAIPGLINTHTHAAMTLFRSYADDMKLHTWLRDKIWPLEAKLTENDVYWGTKLACLEMIKSGTTCFNDMYWHARGASRAADEMGMRAVLSGVFIDLFDREKGDKEVSENKKLIEEIKKTRSDRITPALGPHALYTVSEEKLQWIGEYADKENLLIHFHLAETEKENNDCVEMYKKRPVEFLESIGFLGKNLVAAHCNYLTGNEIKILAKYDVKISHNPISNMKLAAGIMPYPEMKAAGLTISLGTDGPASNNNLDMFESMKFAAIAQKYSGNDPTVMPAAEAFELASANGARALGLNAGAIEEGMLADIILIDLKRPDLAPNFELEFDGTFNTAQNSNLTAYNSNLIANLVYSANGSCVDTTICNGKILMHERKMYGSRLRDEDEILEKSREIFMDLIDR